MNSQDDLDTTKSSFRKRLAAIPRYVYDKRLHNYVDIETGKMVKRNVITDSLKEYLDSREPVVESIVVEYAKGELNKEEFFAIFSGEIANSHKVAAALAMGGWHNMTASTWGVVGAYLRNDYIHLLSFIDDIQNGRYTNNDGSLQIAAIKVRARAYISTSYSIYWKLKNNEMLDDSEISEERWRAKMDDATCSRCAELHSLGWVTKGTLPNPALHPLCRCEKEYR